MSIQTEFFTLVSGLFAAQVYPNVAPEGVVPPYATYTRVSAVEDPTLDTNGGAGNATNTRLQIDVFATTYAAAQSSASAVKTALKGWAAENILLDEQDLYEPDTKLHRVLLEASIWHL